MYIRCTPTVIVGSYRMSRVIHAEQHINRPLKSSPENSRTAFRSPFVLVSNQMWKTLQGLSHSYGNIITARNGCDAAACMACPGRRSAYMLVLVRFLMCEGSVCLYDHSRGHVFPDEDVESCGGG